MQFSSYQGNLSEHYGVDLDKEMENDRLIQHAEDLDSVTDDKVKELCAGSDVFFCCLGTTKAQAGSSQAFYHLDFEIATRMLQLAKEAGVGHASVVTASMSNPNSMFLYVRTKGEVEERTKGLKFDHTSIWRPGLLDRGDGHRRFGEKLVRMFMKDIAVWDLAKAMLQDAINVKQKTSTAEVSILRNDDIWRICRESPL